MEREEEPEVIIHADEPVFTSGVVCRILAIPLWTLKQLDSAGIVSPRRREGRSRLYSQRELVKLKHVWFLMEKRGVKMNGLKVILEMHNGELKLDF
jgi:MerR family transcriptional regulator, heat shock protein HspR